MRRLIRKAQKWIDCFLSVRGNTWHPIETAPLDNKRPLYIARFSPDTGELQSIDFDAIWQCESESWELPQVYCYWASAYGSVEEPTHWAYQEGPPPFTKCFFHYRPRTNDNESVQAVR